jgi:hypothetical protein
MNSTVENFDQSKSDELSPSFMVERSGERNHNDIARDGEAVKHGGST